VISVPKVAIWDALYHYWEKYWSKNGFALGAFNKFKYLSTC
jgi:hypothetical protein